MKWYYIVLYPRPGYWRHFTIGAESIKDAIAKINYQARIDYQEALANDPTDPYSHAQQARHIITATRRYKRSHRPKFACSGGPICHVMELVPNIAYEGHLNLGTGRSNLIVNIFPKLPLSEAQDLRKN